jgi:hypothetical protein
MILLLGDSNFRNMIQEHGESLSAAVGEEVKFSMATSNESLKLQLENREDTPKIVIIGAPLNEINQKYNENKKKGRAETIREVLEEQNKLVRQAAIANDQVLFILVPPFYRAEPQWIGERTSLGVFHVKDFVGDDGPWNIAVANPVKILDSDLGDDKVHLNKTGKEKLRKSIETDILLCKSNLGEEPNLDWASQISNAEPPTPSTIRKRTREESEMEATDEEGEVATVKKAKLDTVLDRMDILLKKMEEERSTSKSEIQSISQKVDEETKKVEEIKTTVDGLKKVVKNDIYFSAQLREDIDGLENENLKNTVIIRKLAAEGVPKDKKELRSFIQTRARELVKTILNEEAAGAVKYAAPLYSFVDASKKDNKEGLVPPFKIGFSNRDIAIKFRDSAVKKSKEEGSAYKDTYFAFFQSFGTKIRTILMWGACEVIKTEKKECWVNMSAAKPTLQIKEGGRIVKTMSFVQTMAEYKDKIPAKPKEEATKLARKHFLGKIEKTFIAIKD